MQLSWHKVHTIESSGVTFKFLQCNYEAELEIGAVGISKALADQGGEDLEGRVQKELHGDWYLRYGTIVDKLMVGSVIGIAGASERVDFETSGEVPTKNSFDNQVRMRRLLKAMTDASEAIDLRRQFSEAQFPDRKSKASAEGKSD